MNIGDPAWLDTGHGYSVPVIIKDLDPIVIESVVSGQTMVVEEPSRLNTRKETKIHVQDVLELSDPSESHILYALQERFRNRRIYTALGEHLVFINPNEPLPIYDGSVLAQIVKNKSDKAHIFSLVRNVVNKIRDGSTAETIVFRGETGSGKTFNAAQAMNALASLAPSRKRPITQNHMEALNRVFHSFGTARTAKNPNSTRFGYVLEFLLKDRNIEGLAIRHTLPLELGRVVAHRAPEKTFNVFYEIVAGLSEAQKEELEMLEEKKFFYLSQGALNDPTDNTDAENFAKLDLAFDTLGFSEEQRSFVYRILAVILHLGNTYFKNTKNANGTEGVELGSGREISTTARLLEINEAKWGAHFEHKFWKTDDGIQSANLNINQALDCRDGIAQLLYEELFAWILNRISQNFKCPEHTAVIRIVDMYGFERYAANSLQQLCINAVNERVHGFYLRKVFEEPISEMAKQGIKQSFEYPGVENAKTIELLFKKPTGLLPLLDDECKFPKATDETYLQHTNLNHLDKSVYGKSRNKDKCEFSVRHYGGTTWYSIVNYIHSNRRAVPAGMIHALSQSHNQNIQLMFRAICGGREFGDYIVYAGLQHSKSIQQIIQALHGTSIHFVACVRANSERQVAKFDLPTVSRQLRSLTILDSVSFRVNNPTMRFEQAEFARRFRCLLPGMIAVHQKPEEIINDILTGQGFAYQDDYQIGPQSVFVSEKLCRRLESRREAVIDDAVVVLQKGLRCLIVRRQYVKQRKAALLIQSAFRGWLARKRYIDLLDSRQKTLSQEARKNKRLQAYQEIANGAQEAGEDEVTLGSVAHLDVGEDIRKTLESPFGGKKTETRTLHNYLSTPTRLIKPTVQPMTIEQFAEQNFKGHLLEVRRSPIATPFLLKTCEADFQLSLSMFKLVLKYMNDATLTGEKLQVLAKIIVQMAISNIHQRDELFIQLANQTYNNPRKANADRGWTLVLCALNSFPPSRLVLPMLLGYFQEQQMPLKGCLVEALLRKVKTMDPTASRIYSSNRLEQLSFTARQGMTVQVETPGGETLLVEAQPWATVNEMAGRILRERGVTNSDGWTVSVESEEQIYAPLGGDFFHDVICEIEGVDNDRPLFFKYSNAGLTVTQPNGPPATETRLNRVRSSPVEKRRVRNFSAQTRDSTTDDSSNSPRSQDEGDRENVYSYTMPRKKGPRSVSEDPRGASRASTLGRGERNRSRGDEYDTIDDRPVSRVNRAPSQNTLRRYHDSQQAFSIAQPIAQPIYVPQGGVQFMPMMMIPTNGGNMMQPIYGTMPQPNPEPRHHREFSNDSLDDAAPSRRTPASRLTGRAPSTDRVPSEYSNLSVASRIRRIPVPRENGDVDRFLDEVFDQVLSPQELKRTKLPTSMLAASIKGGLGDVKNRQPSRDREGYGSSDYDYVERRDVPSRSNGHYDGNNSSGKYYELDDDRDRTPVMANGDNDQMMCMPQGGSLANSQMSHVPSSRLSSYDYDDGSDSPIGSTSRIPDGYDQTGRTYACTTSFTGCHNDTIGLNRIPTELYRVVQNQVSNSEHPTPHKFPFNGIHFAKEQAKKEREALDKLNEANKHLPPPIDAVRLFRPKIQKKEEPVGTLEIPEEPPAICIVPAKKDWGSEVQRSNTRLLSPESHASPIPEPQPARQVPVFLPRAPSPVRQRPALSYVKQPWKLTIRKEMFYPGERLDDPVMISQVFSQIIDDCKKFIPYRIRAHERENVKGILKDSKVPPELLARQDEIPVGVKARVVEAARRWPLYFSQIHEVVEMRGNENIYLLLALSETGLRLLVQNPMQKESPLKIQDHFDFDDIRGVDVQLVDQLVLTTKSGMKVVLRTQRADYIKAQMAKCFDGEVKEKVFMRAVTDYITKEPNLLSFVKGDVIEILTPEDEVVPVGWLHGRLGNRYGNLPKDYVKPLNAPLDDHPLPPPIITDIADPAPPPLPLDDIDINDYNFEDNAYELGIGNDKHTMMEFALMYYRSQGNESGKGKRGKQWTWRDVADKVKWTDRPIQHSLIRIDNAEANKIACEAFGCILRYMGDENMKKSETKTDCVYRLLLICQKNEAMRDEVYCQIIRQTTSNRSAKPDSLALGWRLFSVLTAYFSSSPAMWPYLTKYIAETANDVRRACHGTAQLCLQNLSKTKRYGGRRFLLSGAELEQITMHGNHIKRQHYLLPGGHSKLVNTKTVTVVEEILQDLCNGLNIRSPAEQQEFCVCIAVPNQSLIFAANDEYVLDICTEMEHKNKEFEFILRRTVWIHPLRLDNIMYIDVMFHQILPDYLDGLFCSHMSDGNLSAAAMDDIAKMGAYLYFSSEQRGTNIITPRNIYSLIPATVIDRSIGPDQWASRVQHKKNQIGTLQHLDPEMNVTAARMHFLQILEKWPLFGTTMFPVQRTERGATKEDMVLAIQRRGVQLLTPMTHTVVEEWPFTQILATNKFEKDREMMLDLKIGTMREHVTITLQTNRAVDIIRLLGQYTYVDSQNKSTAY
ncbi:unnamed protein product, partial [Mesorhabditis spiculigera]